MEMLGLFVNSASSIRELSFNYRLSKDITLRLKRTIQKLFVLQGAVYFNRQPRNVSCTLVNYLFFKEKVV